MRFNFRVLLLVCSFTSALLFLSGCGSALSTSPSASLDVTSISFVGQLAGTQSSAQRVVLNNYGTSTLSISGIGISGADQSSFSEKDLCGSTLGPGASCVVSVFFSPTAQGSFSASLTFSDNAADLVQHVTLTGSGVAPQAKFSVSRITFPSTDVGYTALSQAVELTNVGTAVLMRSSIGISGKGSESFQESDTCGASLLPQQTCTFSITFKPSAAMDYAVMLAASSSSAESVLLTGTGSPDTPLSQWRNALLRCRTEPVNLLVFGDSRSVVDSTVIPGIAANIVSTFGHKWTDLLAAALQDQCGSHGTGLVPFLPVAETYSLNDDYYSVSGNWTGYGQFGPSQGGNVPAAQTLEAISPLNITFRAAVPYDAVRVYCEAGPGLNAWKLQVDGQDAGSCGGPDVNEHTLIGSSSTLALTKHTALLVCQQAPCIAYGMEAVSGQSGVSVHNLSIGTCTAECFGSNPATQLAFTDLIPRHDLVILNLLTNEPGVGYSVDSFAAAMTRIVSHERSLSVSPSILVVAPLQDAVGGLSPYYAALPVISTSNSAAEVDVRDSYGTGFMAQYFGPDRVHENDAGYAALFSVLKPVLVP